MTSIPDGNYDVLVIDVTRGDDDVTHIDFVITSGSHKGNVIALRASKVRRAASDLMGTPATITITNGEPRVRFD